jgi:hypothetical protein
MTTVGMAAVLVAASRDARADAQECSAAAESGQTFRASGKWLDAREKFLACSATSCPSVVRTDCAKWASETLDGIPTIVVDARDAAGKDLTDVAVSIDGKMVTTKLDGRGIPLDPGAHKLRFEHAGHAAIDDEIVAKEQVKGRRIAVTFAKASSGGPAAETPVREHSVIPWILVGVGGTLIVAGVVVWVTAPSVPPNCNSSSRTCTPPAVNGTIQNDQAQAEKNGNRHIIAEGLWVGGGVIAVGGLVWHFLEPTGPEKKTAPGSPSLRSGDAGRSARPRSLRSLGVIPTPGGLAVIGSF